MSYIQTSFSAKKSTAVKGKPVIKAIKNATDSYCALLLRKKC